VSFTGRYRLAKRQMLETEDYCHLRNLESPKTTLQSRFLSEDNGLEIIERIGRGERIRTSDPLVPNQVLYQAEPRPVIA
jgi:hypothetical protein